MTLNDQTLFFKIQDGKSHLLLDRLEDFDGGYVTTDILSIPTCNVHLRNIIFGFVKRFTEIKHFHLSFLYDFS